MDKVALPVEPQVFTYTRTWPKVLWDRDEENIREHMERDWALHLWKWIKEQSGEVQLSQRREMRIENSAQPGLYTDEVRLRWQIKATPIGELVPGQFYFYGGSMHGRWAPTDGSPTWIVPVHIPPAHLWVENRFGVQDPEMIIEVYRRDQGVYRFEGTEKR